MGRPGRCCKDTCCCSPWALSVNRFYKTEPWRPLGNCHVGWDFGDAERANILGASFNFPTSSLCCETDLFYKLIDESCGCTAWDQLNLSCWKVLDIKYDFIVEAKMKADTDSWYFGSKHNLWLAPFPPTKKHKPSEDQMENAPISSPGLCFSGSRGILPPDYYNVTISPISDRGHVGRESLWPHIMEALGEPSTEHVDGAVIDTYKKNGLSTGFNLYITGETAIGPVAPASRLCETLVRSASITTQKLPAGCYIVCYSCAGGSGIKDPVSAFSYKFVEPLMGTPLPLHPEAGLCKKRDYILYTNSPYFTIPHTDCKRKDDNENCPPD